MNQQCFKGLFGKGENIRQMIKYDIKFSNYIDSKCQLQNVGFQNFPLTVFSTYNTYSTSLRLEPQGGMSWSGYLQDIS